MSDEMGYEAAFMMQDDTQEREAHFFWTITDFEELVMREGATDVVRNMKPAVAIKLLGALQHELL